ncbi:MAG: AlkZ family DNA glycosylase [Tidjanibacter sp.]|nr:AlkZ family DNA glycosylase [Tidjanibacter sp.]
MNLISMRLLNQQLVSPVFSKPEEVVSHMGAVQAQEYRLMRWAVAMRTKNPSSKVFKAAYDKGEIIRLHLLRGTWQLIAAEDYWWMLRLCAPKSIAIIKGWMHSNGIEISDREHDSILDIFGQVVAGKRSVTKDDLVLALAERGMVMDAHRLSYHIRLAELRGFLCSGDLLPMKATYSFALDKVKPTSGPNGEEALALLARKYFQSHSPATLEDFVWWSGLNISDCRRGISSLGREMHREWVNGREFLFHDSCRTRGFRKGHTILLPSYDEYLIGYKSRDVVLAPEHKHYAHNNSGIFYPVVVRNGRVCGNWKPFGKELSVDFFADGSAEMLSAAWNNYQRFNNR